VTIAGMRVVSVPQHGHRHDVLDILARMGVDPASLHRAGADGVLSVPAGLLGLGPGAAEPERVVITPRDPQRSWWVPGRRLGGDVVDLVRAVTGASIGEAVALIERGGAIPVRVDDPALPDEVVPGPDPNDEPQSTRTSVTRLREVNEASWAFYTEAGPAARARACLVDLGVDPRGLAVLDHRGGEPLAGHTALSTTGLVDRLRRTGFTADEVVDAGWAVRRSGSGTVADRFRNRLLLPYREQTAAGGALGSVVGAVGLSTTWAPGARHAQFVDHARTALLTHPRVLVLPSCCADIEHRVTAVAATAIDAIVTAATCAARLRRHGPEA
jgi:hypothetical protein